MTKPFIRVLGASNWHQTKGNDFSCYTINDEILVDASAGIISHLLDADIDPMQIHTVCFTHLHADHFMGLAPLFLYRTMRTGTVAGLRLIGPADQLERGFELAMDYAFDSFKKMRARMTEMPERVGLKSGEST